MIMLNKNETTQVLLANSSTFPSDGLVFFIKNTLDKKPVWGWDEKKFVEAYSLAISIANKLVVSNHFFELWSNIISRSDGIYVFGRRINSSDWGKPITVIRKHEIVSKKDIQKLKLIISSIQPVGWSGPNQHLFSLDSLEHKRAQAIFWDNRNEKKKKFVLATTEKFIVTLPTRPHCNGLHIQIFPRNAYWDVIGDFVAPWQLKDVHMRKNRKIIQSNIELALLVKKIIHCFEINSGKRLKNYEFHMSGNWSESLQNAKKILRDSIFMQRNTILPNNKEQKEIAPIKKTISLGGTGHGNIYANVLKEKIILPSRPEKEKPSEWRHIETISLRKAIELQKLIHSHLI